MGEGLEGLGIQMSLWLSAQDMGMSTWSREEEGEGEQKSYLSCAPESHRSQIYLRIL